MSFVLFLFGHFIVCPLLLQTTPLVSSNFSKWMAMTQGQQLNLLVSIAGNSLGWGSTDFRQYLLWACRRTSVCSEGCVYHEQNCPVLNFVLLKHSLLSVISKCMERCVYKYVHNFLLLNKFSICYKIMLWFLRYQIGLQNMRKLHSNSLSFPLLLLGVKDFLSKNSSRESSDGFIFH